MDVLAVEEGIARSQHGVVTRVQLAAAGLTPAQIRTRLERGQLHRIHQGVYAVATPSLLPLSAYSAALLAVGPDALLSHRSAAALWSLAPADPEVVNVILVNGSARGRQGVRIHRVARLDARDITTKDNLRITKPARTVIDFAAGAVLSEVVHAVSEARALKLLTDVDLHDALARVHPTHPGAAVIRALLRRQVGRVITRSTRERAMLALIEAAGLPAPRVNARLHGYVPDFYWPEEKLILEFDGFGTHGSRPAFESDRKRDQVLAAAGVQTIRATWLQLEREPVALAVRVGQALAARVAVAVAGAGAAAGG